MLPHAWGPGKVFSSGSAEAFAFHGPLPTRLSNPPAGTAAAYSAEVGCQLLTMRCDCLQAVLCAEQGPSHRVALPVEAGPGCGWGPGCRSSTGAGRAGAARSGAGWLPMQPSILM